MAGAWQQAQQKILDGHKLLHEAESELSQAFEGSCRYMRIEWKDLDQKDTSRIITDLKRKA